MLVNIVMLMTTWIAMLAPLQVARLLTIEMLENNLRLSVHLNIVQCTQDVFNFVDDRGEMFKCFKKC